MTKFVIASYPNAQQAAVLGLQDLLQTAVSFLTTDSEDLFQVEIAKEFDPCSKLGCDVLILPPSLGGVLPDNTLSNLADWVRSQHANGSLICSVCVGTFVLAETGLLEGRPATTHWDLASAFRRQYPDVHLDENKLIVDDGDVISAGGMMAWTDLAMLLIARYLGPSIMQKTAKVFLIDPGRREQSYYNLFSPDLSHGDSKVLRTQHWLQLNFRTSVNVQHMAEVAGLEERTFLRRFQAATGHNPSEYLQKLRVAQAREMLELTSDSIESIAASVGYLDASSFGKLFNKLIGLPPGEYRRRFSPTRK